MTLGDHTFWYDATLLLLVTLTSPPRDIEPKSGTAG